MKKGRFLLLVFAGFLALSSCTNPLMERLFVAEKEPDTPLTVTYTVSFDTNGGSLVPSQKVAKGEKAARPNNPTKSGFGFVNWYDNAEFTEPHYDFATPVTRDITLYAQWSSIFYTVTFHSNGGIPAPAPQDIGEGGTASRPSPDPAKDGYAFGGWYGDLALTILYDFNTPVTGNLDLYAQWLQVFTVSFDSDGGSAVDSQTVTEGGTATRPDNPTKSGFGFVNWYDNAECTEPHYDFATPVFADIILYAKWSNTFFTVEFDSNGGSEVASQNVGEGGTANKPTHDPTKDGYAFDGWYSDYGLTTAYDFDTPVTHDITLYAKWLAVYTVTFISNGGSEVPSQPVVEGGTAIMPIQDLIRDGHEFGGWYIDEELTIEYDFATPVTGNLTLYAQWNRNFYTVTFVSNGGSPAPEPQEIAKGGKLTHPPAMTKAGHNFGGWYQDAAFENKWDFAVDTVNDDLILYAQWNENPPGTFTVTFVSEGGIEIPDQIVVDGGKVTQPTGLARDGYSFIGWYKEAAFENEWNFALDTVTHDLILYAKWNLIVISVSGVTLNKTSLTLAMNGEETLAATVQPPNATNQSVSWLSSNISVAAVNDGTVKALAAGTATITVTTEDGNKTATCTVMVTSINYIPLVENVWADGEITATTPNKEDWYSIEVENGTTYYIWWNDSYQGGLNAKTLDVKVSAQYENGTSIFTGTDSGWSTPSSFVASSNGMVYVKVNPFSSGGTGTYAIVYSTTNTRPIGWIPSSPILLTENVWENGEVNTATPNHEVWYSISAAAGIRHYLWWNDLYQGDNTKTLNVKISVWYDNGNIISFSTNGALDGPLTFIHNSGGMIYIRVSPYSGNATGTYGLVYSTSNARPGWTPPTNTTPLIENIWANGEITTATPKREDWYSISVTANTTYYLWWNDSYQDASNKTLDIRVSALNNGISLFSDVDNGWSSPSSFTATTTGTVYVRVYPFSSGSTGTYGIVYSTTNTRPGISTLFTISVTDIVDHAPANIDGGIISRTGNGVPQTLELKVEPSDSFDQYKWSTYVFGGANAGTYFVLSETSSCEVDAKDSRYNSLGGHTVYLEVRKGALWYSTNIEFRIVE